jgi:RNA polymerase sigma-70 factor, ECF subfamily
MRGVVAVETDEQLLRRVAMHDAAAFGVLWERLGGPVLALAGRILADPYAAEDATQEAFTAIWRAADGFDPERGSALAWVFAIARNAARDIARRRRVIAPVEPPDVADPAGDPHELAADAFEAFTVHAAVASLGPRAREVLELAYFDGLTQSQIAERTATPLGTVKTRTRNALARLAEQLAPVQEPR